MWKVVTLLLALGVTLPLPAEAMRYQTTSDGLVSVHVTQDPSRGHPTALRLCAKLLRPEPVAALEIRLNFWAASGGLLAQRAAILQPSIAAPICRQIPVPPAALGFGRWEIGRVRVLPHPAPQPTPDRRPSAAH